VDDSPTHRALLGEGLNLGHHVMMGFLFNGQGAVDIDIFNMLLQIGQLDRGNQAGFMLGCGQGQPDLTHQPPPVRF
jgi:hypothetical protein